MPTPSHNLIACHTPETYARRILLCVTGLSPQVVTETLHALCTQQSPAFIPTEIRLLSTQEGADRARLSLLDPVQGQFHAWCQDHDMVGRIAFDESCITVLQNQHGEPMTDMRTPEDNARAADTIMAQVRELCGDPQCAIHASIAGGRKTMGFYLGYAMSLFARPQDRLSHVLITQPFESLPEFFFPPRQARVLYTREGRPVSTADARIMLAEIPIVRLRDGLPAPLLSGDADYSATVAQAQHVLGPPQLRISWRDQAAYCAGQRVPLQPLLLAWYAWFAQQRLHDGEAHTGLRYTDIDTHAFAHFLTQHSPESGLLDRTLVSLLRNGIDQQFFEQKRSRLNAELRKALGNSYAPYCIAATGRRPLTRYSLNLPASCIHIEHDYS